MLYSELVQEQYSSMMVEGATLSLQHHIPKQLTHIRKNLLNDDPCQQSISLVSETELNEIRVKQYHTKMLLAL